MGGRNYTVPCKPIGSLIRGAGMDVVDFFVLDVEGAELSVLHTMDWNIPVLVWSIELDRSNPSKDQAVRELLQTHGYSSFTRQGINEIFVPDMQVARKRASQCQECASKCLADI